MNNISTSTVETNNIWVDVDQYYENTLSPELVHEMEELGLSIYESEGIPRILHKDSLGKVLNDEYQILENNRGNFFRLLIKSEIHAEIDRFLLLSSLLWCIGVLITGFSIGFLIENIFNINLQYFVLLAVALMPILTYLIFLIEKPYFTSKNISYFLGALTLIILYAYLFHQENLSIKNKIINLQLIIEIIISLLPFFLFYFRGFKKFLNFVDNKKIIDIPTKLIQNPIEVSDYPGYEDAIKKRTLEFSRKSIDQYFHYINEDTERLKNDNYEFMSFHLKNRTIKKSSNFFLLFKNRVELQLIHKQLQDDMSVDVEISESLLGSVYPITYSSNKNFIHIGNLPVDEEKIATLVAEKLL
ncbi:hypothetical protein KA405_01905 [Patescibacteria group bacterium]|nr:hypothetical protein [Patescibacteria group bacterium]